MRRTLTFLFFFFSFFITKSQIVSNIDAYQNGNYIIVTYNLSDKADIKLLLSLDGGKTFQQLESVTGDVGKNISSGDKSIVWHVLAELPMLKGDRICFCIEASSCKDSDTPTISSSRKVFHQNKNPQKLTNCGFLVYYYDLGSVYNIQGNEVCKSIEISDLDINPTGSTYSTINSNNKITIWKVNSYNERINQLKLNYTPTSLCYSNDAKNIVVGSSENCIVLYNTQSYDIIKKIETTFQPHNIKISPNGYFVVASNGGNLFIWNKETASLRKVLVEISNINDYFFSKDNSMLAVLTQNGVLTIYDTQSFNPVYTIKNLGIASKGVFHTENKYVAIITNDKSIEILNIKNPDKERFVLNIDIEGVTNLNFEQTIDGRTFLIYNTSKTIEYYPIQGLIPNYWQLLKNELAVKMGKWTKQLAHETDREYYNRVNENTREEQTLDFKIEIATRLAGNLVEQTKVSFGKYNFDKKTLSINFEGIPSIDFYIPKEDVLDFMNIEKIEFKNVLYNLNEKDEFSIWSAEILNKKKQKTYFYKKEEEQQQNKTLFSNNSIPLELIQLSSQDEKKLQNIKAEVLETAKNKKMLTDHTNISVSSNIITDIDADGNDILNYNIDFSYDVDVDFSAMDDFGAGRYLLEESNAACTMMEIVKNSIEKDFSKYINEGKKLKITITGTADSSPIKGRIIYYGQYGDYNDFPIYNNDKIWGVTVERGKLITENEQLAFCRALGVKNYVETKISSISKMDIEYIYNVKVSKEKGSGYRRISIMFSFVDAFDK